VNVEALQGRKVAVDASIWLVQFVKAMRDERGDMLPNAHLLGFFRRICRLLYHRIRPVFVFDGATPVLKYNTTRARRRVRDNDQARMKRTAEKLLLNTMKASALKQALNAPSRGGGEGNAEKVAMSEIDDDDDGDGAALVDLTKEAAEEEEDDGEWNAENEYEYEEEEEEDSEEEEEEEMMIPDDDDVDPAVLASLPPSVQMEVMLKMREKRVADNREKFQSASGKMADFSALQMSTYLKSTKLKREMESVIKGTGGGGGGGGGHAGGELALVDGGADGGAAGDEPALRGARVAGAHDREFIFRKPAFGDAAAAAAPSNIDMFYPKRPSEWGWGSGPGRGRGIGAGGRGRGRARGYGANAPLRAPRERFLLSGLHEVLPTPTVAGTIAETPVMPVDQRAGNDGKASLDLHITFDADEVLKSGGIDPLFAEDGDDDGGAAAATRSEPAPEAATAPAAACADDDDDDEWEDVVDEVEVEDAVEEEVQEVEEDWEEEEDEEVVEVEELPPPREPPGVGGGAQALSRKDVYSIGHGFLKGRSLGQWDADDAAPPPAPGGGGGGDDDGGVDDGELPASLRAALKAVDALPSALNPVRKVKIDPKSEAREPEIAPAAPAPETTRIKTVAEKDEEEDVRAAIAASLKTEPSVAAARADDVVVLDFDDGEKAAAEEDKEEYKEEEAEVAAAEVVEVDVDAKDEKTDGALNASFLEETSPPPSSPSPSPPPRETPTEEEEVELAEEVEEEVVEEEEEEEEGGEEDEALDEPPSPGAARAAARREEAAAAAAREEAARAASDAIGPVSLLPPLGADPIVFKTLRDFERAAARTREEYPPYLPPEHVLETTPAFVECDGRRFDACAPVAESLAGIAAAIRNAPRPRVTSGVATTRGDDDEGDVDDAALLAAAERAEAEAANRLRLERLLSQTEVEREVLTGEHAKARRGADPGNLHEMHAEVQQLLTLFGIPYIIAPQEAEAQCAWLDREGFVDAVITDDSDAFLFGAKTIYRNVFESKKYVEFYDANRVDADLGLDRAKMAQLALLLGSDYAEGVTGVGIVNALEVVLNFPGVEGLTKFAEWVGESEFTGKVPKTLALPASKGKGDGKKTSAGDGPDDDDDDDDDDEPAAIREFKLKHRTLKKAWELPRDFPSERVLDAYANPSVDASREKFEWGEPDLDALRLFCGEHFAWRPTQTDDLLLPVVKMWETSDKQSRIDSFFAAAASANVPGFNQRFSKVRSARVQRAIAGLTGKPLDEEIALAEEDDASEKKKKKKKPRRGKKTAEDLALTSNEVGNVGGDRGEEVVEVGDDGGVGVGGGDEVLLIEAPPAKGRKAKAKPKAKPAAKPRAKPKAKPATEDAAPPSRRSKRARRTE